MNEQLGQTMAEVPDFGMTPEPLRSLDESRQNQVPYGVDSARELARKLTGVVLDPSLPNETYSQKNTLEKDGSTGDSAKMSDD